MAKNKIKYPLEQVLEIKIRRVNQAEKVVQEKKEILEKEQKKLRGYQEAYQKVEDHHKVKIDQLREALDAGSPSHKIEQIRVYIKEVKDKMYEEKRKVERQEKQVERATKELEAAQKVLKERRLEVDKLETHKGDWSAKELKELRRLEAKEQDEIGSLVFLSNKRKEMESQKRRAKRKVGDGQ